MGGGEEGDDGKRRRVVVEAKVACKIRSDSMAQMRAHLDDQGNRSSDSNKNIASNLQKGSEGSVAENGGTEARCPVCCRSFRSKKAMYGHMRCHPEREWRGINPPPSAKTSFSSSVSQKNDGLSPSAMKSTVVSSDTSPSQPPLRWTRTGRRGQNHPFSPSSRSVSSTDISSSRKRGTLMLKEMTLVDTELGAREAGRENNTEEESGSKNTTDRSKKQNKLNQEIVSQSLLVAPREYKCSTCDKVFPTFQALGGHRSGHSYKNNLLIMGAGEEESKEGAFKCKICSKTFPSGQALGGHKRTHSQGSTEASPPSQDSASGKARKSLGGKVLGIDINELPPMEE